MKDRPKKPDFVVDQYGNVQDVRHNQHPLQREDTYSQGRSPGGIKLSSSWISGSGFNTLRRWIKFTWGSLSKMYSYLFALRGGMKSAGDSLSEMGGCLLAFLGGILIVGGLALVIGNISGLFPTFPFAGFITMSIGFAVTAAASRMND